MQTLHVYESSGPLETALAGRVTLDDDGRLAATREPGSPRASVFEAAWNAIRARPTLTLRSRVATSGEANHVERQVGPGDDGYLWAVKSEMLALHGLRCEVQDGDSHGW